MSAEAEMKVETSHKSQITKWAKHIKVKQKLALITLGTVFYLTFTVSIEIENQSQQNVSGLFLLKVI